MAKSAPELQPWQTVPPASLTPEIEDSSQQQSLLISVRQSPGFPVATGQVAHAILSRANQAMLDYTAGGCATRYLVDGMWEAGPPLAREVGDPMLVSLKQLCQLNPADRRNPQSGSCQVKQGKTKFRLILKSQGTAQGERVLLRFDPEQVPFHTLSDLGMRDSMIEQFREALNSENSSVLIGSPRGMGLTSTWNVALNSADRLIRDFQSLEPETEKEPEIINVSPNFYGGTTGLVPPELLRKMILKEPDVFVFPSIPDDATFATALQQAAGNEKQVIARYPANSAIEACARVYAQFPNSAKDFASTIKAVLNQRLVRRLCETCKKGFQPSPALLQKLGIPPGRVTTLYQQFVMPPIEEQVDANGKPAPIPPCATCQARGYLGRIAIFELFLPGPQFRAALPKTRDIAQLTRIAQAEGFRSLQSEAILTVARGLTTLDEVKRVFSKPSA
ncbi:MAG: general secretion pathway protein GspE [Planctomycetaceae bacterium]|nr:MAG: general secretion pathway protein GspE [Planctomycetaceae bacterium]